MTHRINAAHLQQPPMDDPALPTEPAEYYTAQVERNESRIREIERADRWFRRLRLAAAIIAGACAVAGWSAGGLSWWYVGVVVAILGLAGIAKWHQRLLHESRMLGLRVQMGRQQLARMARDWKRIQAKPHPIPAEHRSEAADLDLSGKASLFQLACCAFTPMGVETFHDWLLTPAPPDEIESRQQAVRQLAPNRPLREKLELHGRLLQQGRSDPEKFLLWAESPPFLHQRTVVKWLARAMTISLVFTALLFVVGVVGLEILCLVLLGVILVNAVLNVMFAGTIHDIFTSVSSRNNSIQHYRELLTVIAELPADCDYFRQLRTSMGDSADEPLAILGSLQRIVTVSDIRRDPLFGALYLLLQVILLTDFHVLSVLEQWQAKHGSKVRDWLESIGRLEAVASLATLAHDNPDWCFPVVRTAESPTLSAEQIGHPLLPPQVCVRNDVKVGPPGTFLLVTGSNMSGKSTLLRSVGVNAALAQAGGPVCARSMMMSPLKLATSMRVTDSLSEGVSFFMAELKRLKQIVDQSHAMSHDKTRTLLFIFDEILQGTNSAERHIAVSRVVGKLVHDGSLGMVSTHDLELASTPELVESCNPVHLRETIGNVDGEQKMTFDYLMRDGVAPTTNALKLLELVGLKADESNQ